MNEINIFYMWKISSKITCLSDTKFFTFKFCSTIQNRVIFTKYLSFYHFPKSPLKSFATQMVFSDASLTLRFFSLLVTAYTPWSVA